MGCGWLGLPTAVHLGTKGFAVKGTTTSVDKLKTLSEVGVTPFHLKLTENGIEGAVPSFFEGLDLLILNIPPKLRRPPFENYVHKIGHLKKAIENASLSKVIFVSSTSVYGAASGEVTEETIPNPVTESGKQLLASEHMLQSSSKFETTVIRFGGLIGAHRHPITFLSGRGNLTNGDELINLIQLEDCIGIIQKIIDDNYWGKVVNGVYPHHPTKREFYRSEAAHRGLEPPKYSLKNPKGMQKLVKNKNFLYKYRFPVTTA